ncbi:MAG: orotidine-5'-phosphate decarboxylase [Pseudohongiellaceae bacterium]
MAFDKKCIIVALDFSNAADTLALVDQLDPSICRVKVGKELFTACGPDIVRQVMARGFEVFLDMKFHDIPTTVARATLAAAELGVWMLNVHCAGGRVMMESAVQSIENLGADKPLLIGVTVLTSLAGEELVEVGLDRVPDEQILRLALLAQDCGLEGVVCSATEAPMLRSMLPQNFHLVTPGIRRHQDANDDQKRITGPLQALQNGSSFLVIGRPITRADSPEQALREIYEEILAVG